MEPNKIKVSDAVAAAIGKRLEAAMIVQEQLKTYIAGVAAALEVPDGFTYSPQGKCFVEQSVNAEEN